MTPLETVQKYYDAFNRREWAEMLSLVHPEVRHEPNQGEARIGKEKFAEFLEQMDAAYEEKLTNMVFFTTESHPRVAVEFTVNGIYKQAEEGLPPARNQAYVLPAGAFLEVEDEKVSRITTYYNLPLWKKLVS